MVSGVNGCDFTGHFFIEGALFLAFNYRLVVQPLDFVHQASNLHIFSLETMGRTLSSPLRSSQLSSAVTTHPCI